MTSSPVMGHCMLVITMGAMNSNLGSVLALCGAQPSSADARSAADSGSADVMERIEMFICGKPLMKEQTMRW